MVAPEEVKVVFKPVENIKGLYIESTFKILASRFENGVRIIEQIELISAALYGGIVENKSGKIILDAQEEVDIDTDPTPTLAEFMAKHGDAEIVEG